MAMLAVCDGVAKLLLLDHGVPIEQIMWARFAFFLVPMIFMLPWQPARHLPSRRMLPFRTFQAFLPVVAGGFMVAGVAHMSLADATVILFTSPLLITALAIPLLGETVRPGKWIPAAFGFLGVLVVMRPGGGIMNWAALLPLACAVCTALYQITIKMPGRGAPPFTLLLQSGLVASLATTVVLPFVWVWPSGEGWVLMIVSGLTSGAALYLGVRAFAMANASTLAPFAYTRIVAALLFGLLVFGEVPDLQTVLGAAIIILSGLFVFCQERLSGSK